MTKLYELTEAYLELMAQMEECCTPDEEAIIAAQIDAISDDIARKGEAFARMVRMLEGDIACYDTEIKRLQKNKKTAENMVARLKGHILFSMGIAGATELHTTIGKWRIAKNPPKVVIIDETRLPEEFFVEQPPKLMPSLIMQNYRDTGEIPDGCEIVQEESVRFR